MSSGSSSSGAPSESAADAEAEARILRLKELRQCKIELEKRQEAERQQKVAPELARKRELLLALRTLLLTTQRLGFLLAVLFAVYRTSQQASGPNDCDLSFVEYITTNG